MSNEISTTNNAPQTLSTIELVRKMEPEFKQLLDTSNTDIKKFMNNALMAIKDKPEIASGEVSRKSVFDVCSRAANDGVVLDGKEAAIIIGSVKRGGQWVKEAQYRLMAGGVMKMINRSPNIERVVCQLVYEHDDFYVDFVTDGESIRHKITPEVMKKGRGEVIGVYFTAKLTNGEWTSPELMSVEEVNKVRDAYSKKNSEGKFSQMWENSWGEGARKTVLHRARKRLTLDAKIDASLAQDDEAEVEIVDHSTGEVVTEKPAKATRGRAAAAVKAAITEQPQPDYVDATINEEPEPVEKPKQTFRAGDAVVAGEEPPL